MIQRIEIDGKPAFAAYLTEKFEPVDDIDEAALVKVMFDDGTVIFMTPDKENDANSSR